MKAAILGMGAMGKIHKQTYEAAGIEVVATYDPKQDGRYRDCTPLHKKPDCYGMVAQTIENADIVSICSTDDVHAAQIIQCFDSNKHVFCEKPLCHTCRELEAIKAAYEPKKHKCALGMNFPLRWHSPFVEAKRRVQAGELGEIYLAEADYEYGRLPKIIHGWRGQMDKYDIVMGGGLHMIDIMWWVTGNEPFSVQDAVSQNFFGPEHAKIGLFESKGGGIFKLTCDFGGSTNHARRLRISGTEDSLYIDDRASTDKSAALKYFLDCQMGERKMRTKDIFRVHEIGLGL